ncbi:MAG TPA: hypothetical protein DEQ61_19990 [Streptomyces sp.]|nr:hypothetical protein [Streptomyces sp.]
MTTEDILLSALVLLGTGTLFVWLALGFNEAEHRAAQLLAQDRDSAAQLLARHEVDVLRGTAWELMQRVPADPAAWTEYDQRLAFAATELNGRADAAERKAGASR